MVLCIILLSLPFIASTTESAQYHGFKLYIIWPPSFCKTCRWKCKQVPQNFIVSRLIPLKTAYDGKTVLENNILRLHRQDLDTVWTNLKINEGEFDASYVTFYAQQFVSNGRKCSSRFTPDEYILLAISVGKLRIKQVDDAFQAAGVGPNAHRPYKLEKIVKAIEEFEKFKGFTILIVCIKAGDIYYLTGFYFCLTDDGEDLLNCAEDKLHFCPDAEDVYFPPRYSIP